MTTIETETHVFEKAGLGNAPFQCVGMFSIPSTSLAASNPDAYNNAMASLPRDMNCGSCTFCGTAIMHHYIVKSANDRKFTVGCDCVGRTGDAGLIKEVKQVRVRIMQEQRTAKRNLKAAERQALWMQERAERAAIFNVEHTALIERARPYLDAQGFIKDVVGRGMEGAYISEKALIAVEKAIADIETIIRMRENSRHVGTIGKRETFTVRVQRINYFERPSFAGYGYETVYIVTLRDANDNAIVVKSSSFRPEKDQQITIKATVKEHNNYKGEQQTIVQRVKITA